MAEKYEPGSQTIEKVLKLIKDKSGALCIKPPLPPHSLTKELVQEAAKEFTGMFLSIRIPRLHHRTNQAARDDIRKASGDI